MEKYERKRQWYIHAENLADQIYRECVDLEGKVSGTKNFQELQDDGTLRKLEERVQLLKDHISEAPMQLDSNIQYKLTDVWTKYAMLNAGKVDMDEIERFPQASAEACSEALQRRIDDLEEPPTSFHILKSKIASMTTPSTLLTIFICVVVFPSILYLPLNQYQNELWFACVLTFFIGDSITTSLLSKFGLEEREKGYTRAICGAEPSWRCSFATRALALIGLFSAHWLILRYEIGLWFEPVASGIFSLPLILAVGGLGATCLNSYAIYRSWRG